MTIQGHKVRKLGLLTFFEIEQTKTVNYDIVERALNLNQMLAGDLLFLTPVAQTVKRLSTVRETWVRSLGWEDALEKEMGNPLQYYCLENPMDRGAWQATVHGVAKSQTRLSDFTFLSFPYIIRACMLSQLICVHLFATAMDCVAHQTPLSMEFSRQEYYSGLPFPSSEIFLTQLQNLPLLCLLYWQVDLLSLAAPRKPYLGSHLGSHWEVI